MRTTPRRIVSLLVIFSFVLGLTVTVSATVDVAPAYAQRVGSIELVNQVAAIKPGRPFTMNMLVQGGTNEHLVSAKVFSPVTSRSEFRLQTNGFAEFGEAVRSFEPTAVRNLRSGQSVSLSVIVLEWSTSDSPDADADLYLAQPGVYPIVVTLAAPDGTQQDELLTYLVVTPRGQQCVIDPPEESEDSNGTTEETGEATTAEQRADCLNPLRVNITMPIQAAPALQADQTNSLGDADIDRMTTVIDVLASRPSMDLTMAVVPESVVALQRDAEFAPLLDQLSIATADREVLRQPYVVVDEEGWRDARLVRNYGRLLRAGDRVLQREIEVGNISSTTFLDSNATPDTVSMLAKSGYTNFVIAENRLDELQGDAFPLSVTQTFEIADESGTAYPAAASDLDLAQHFGSNDNTILDAHNFIADLAVLWFDQPAITRGVVVRPPSDWDVDDAVLTLALSGITATPIFRAVDLEMFFDEVSALPNTGQSSSQPDIEPSEIRMRELAPSGDTENLVDFAQRLGRAEETLVSYEEILGGRTPDTAPLRELLLIAGSRGFGPSQRLDYLEAVADEVETVADRIIGPEDTLVSITAREADIPVTFENELATAARVTLSVSSDKLEFPDGATQSVVLEPGRNDLTIAVKSRSSGDARLRINVLSPDGTIQLTQPSNIVVRSTVFSGLGLIILVAALIVLALWWLQQHRTELRRRKELEGENDPGIDDVVDRRQSDRRSSERRNDDTEAAAT